MVSNLHLFFVVLGMIAFAMVVAFALTATLERREDGDA